LWIIRKKIFQLLERNNVHRPNIYVKIKINITFIVIFLHIM